MEEEEEMGYHGWLLCRICRRPATTIINLNTTNRCIRVRPVMEVRFPPPSSISTTHQATRRVEGNGGLGSSGLLWWWGRRGWWC